MIKRTASYGISAMVSVVIVLGIIVAVNVISSLYFARADLTEDKRFTVSKPTRDVLAGLEDLVTINVYFSKELPSYVMPLKTRVKDLLDEYKAYSGGNLQVDFIDPDLDPEQKQKMQFMGIPPVQLNVIQKDKAELVTVYLGLAVLYENKKEVIPVIKATENLEYQLTSCISKITMKEIKTVGLLLLSDGMDIEKDFSMLRDELKGQYDVKELDLSAGERDFRDVDTMLVLGTKELSDYESFLIDQAIMKGTNVIFLADMIQREPGKLLATPKRTNLIDIIAKYGLDIGENLVLDRHSAMASFSSGFMSFSLPYPFWIKVAKDGLSQTNPAVSQLSSAIFPWTSSVQTAANGNPNIKFDVLAKSSERSWLQTGRYDLNPQQKFVKSSTSSHDLAIEATGVFKSVFAGQEAPKPPTDPKRRTPEKAQEVLQESPPETKIVVIGGSFLVNNEFLNRYRANLLFVQNLIDVMTLGQGLVGIRARGMDERPLDEVSEGTKSWAKYGNMIGIPILVILFGLVRYYLRRRMRGAL
ncbi:GldG family protein [bacterium]|nr:GldG family protein [bacterium]